jgi:hypothetical protein
MKKYISTRITSKSIFPVTIGCVLLGLMLFGSCTKEEVHEELIIPTKVNFAQPISYIPKDKMVPALVELTLARPLEKDGTVTIQQIAEGTSATAGQYTLDPGFVGDKLTLNLPKGTATASFKITSLHNFNDNKTVAFRIISATGAAIFNFTQLETVVNMRGNLWVDPSVSSSVAIIPDFGSLTVNANSASKSYVLTGLNLSAPVMVTAPTHFKVSLDNVTFASSVSADVNNKSATIYVKFNPSVEANLDVNASITHVVAGLANMLVGVAGKIVYTPEVPLLNENFDYGNATDFLARLTNNWTAYSAAGAIPVAYTPQGLTFTRYGASNIGGAVTMQNGDFSREDVASVFPQTTTGTIYLASLINLSKAGAGEFFLSIRDAAGGFFNRVYVKDGGANNLTFGLGKNATVQYATLNHKYNTTYLVVTKYDFATKISSMYVFDGTFPDTEPTTALAVSLPTGTSPANLTDISIRQAETDVSATIDGVRVATTWRGVLGY